MFDGMGSASDHVDECHRLSQANGALRAQVADLHEEVASYKMALADAEETIAGLRARSEECREEAEQAKAELRRRDGEWRGVLHGLQKRVD